MRVAVTLEQCWHDVPGGVATSAVESLRALGEHTDLDLVGVAARHPAPPREPFVPPVPVRHLPLPRLALYESWHRLRRPAVQRATGPVDVIHVTGMAMPPRSAPMVVTVHDLVFLDDPSRFTPRGVRFFHRAIELARRDADIVVCPSETTAEACRRNGFADRRIRIVPWGIDPVPVAPDDIERVRRRHHLAKPYVLWLGTIEPRKNLPVLLDAFASLARDDVDLVIGGGAGWNDELAALERRSPASVRRIGFVPPEDLPALYAGAAVFCFPSLQEGFGLPVLEAMAQGAPVVTSEGTATAEVVGDAGRTVDPRDTAALATALHALLDDPVEARRLGQAGLERVRARFTWERTAAGLVGAYTDAIDLARAEPQPRRRRSPRPVPAGARS
jgi:glycosyltransferase involved in cell wall biosynthesis